MGNRHQAGRRAALIKRLAKELSRAGAGRADGVRNDANERRVIGMGAK